MPKEIPIEVQTAVKSRCYAFTVNNYTDNDLDVIMDLDNLRYCRFGFEVGAQGTPHIQGFFMFNNQTHFSALKKKLPSHWHFEPKKGTKIENLVYVSKDYQWFEFGNRPHQGKPGDLEVIRYDILNGKSDKWIADNYFSRYMFHFRGIEKYRQLVENEKKAQYDTKLISYNQTYIPEMVYVADYCNQNGNSYIQHEFISDMELILKYKSGRYEYIFVPFSAAFMRRYCDYLYGYIFKDGDNFEISPYDITCRNIQDIDVISSVE